MLKLVLSSVFLLLCFYCTAQRVVDVNKDNVNVGALVFFSAGEPFSPVKYVKVVEGTPYFKEEWMRGSVLSKDNVEYMNLQLRLDLLSNTLEYIDKNGQQMVTTTPVREVRLVDSMTGQSFVFVHSSSIMENAPEQTWLQAVVSGKASLYKKINKSLLESKPYGSASTEQKILSTDQYYLFTGNSLYRIKKFKDLPGMLPGKKTETSKFISDKKLSGKAEQDYIDLVSFYNQ